MEKSKGLGCKLVPESYIQQGVNSLVSSDNLLSHLLEQRRLPERGWSDLQIERCLAEIALMDSNNFTGNVGGGEREGRVYSNIVKKRHFHLAHGMGRSGDIAANQPKAGGSALMCRITEGMALDVIKHTGCKSCKACLVLPVATGMAILLSLLYLRQTRPNAKVVIWPRIDQKTCIKAPQSAGCTVNVIQNKLEGDVLVTDVAEINNVINRIGAENVLCVLTTTSCFAPRSPDKLIPVSKLCKEYDVPHVVNNAYGVQIRKYMSLIHNAGSQGRIDYFIQSLDKNFMVPVGGSIIGAFDKQLLKGVSETYPGRGSSSPTTDLFITLLSVGRNGLDELLDKRNAVFEYLKRKLTDLGSKYQEKVLETPENKISLAFTLSALRDKPSTVTEIGSMLFQRNVTGARAVFSDPDVKDKIKSIGSLEFKNFGSHSDNYPVPYITFAGAIGMTKADVDVLSTKFDKILDKVYNKHRII